MRFKLKQFSTLSILVLFVLVPLLTFAPNHAHAAAAAQWVNHSTIVLNTGDPKIDGTYVDHKIDNNWFFDRLNDPDTCIDFIEFHSNNPSSSPTLHTRVPDQFNTSNCDKSPQNKTQNLTMDPASIGNADIFFVQSSPTDIVATDNGIAFKLNNGFFLETGGDSCKDSIQIDPNDPSVGTLIPRTNGSHIHYAEGWSQFHFTYQGEKDGCSVYSSAKVRIGPPGPDGSVGSATGPGGTPQNPADTQDLKCHTAFLNPLTWLFCPLIKAGSEAARQFDNAINSQLVVDTNTYLNETDNSTGKGFYTAWNSMRDIAVALLVVIGLVMVISTAFSVGPFDAYTVKKVLPRLLLSVIFISLSWPLTKFMINLTNDLGNAVRGIIYSPFSQLGPATINSSTSSTVVLVGGAALALGGTMAATFSLILVALVGAAIGLLVLVFRKMLILVLVVLAPVAIACSILPNTQKAWKLWHESFNGALLAFPIISGMIATGHVFAQIASQVPGGGILNQMIVFIAYFGPYFLLPAAFKLAGGILTRVGGVANDKGRGFFDRQKKFRQRKTSEAFAKGKNYSRFSDRNAVTRGLNTAIGAGVHPRDLMRGKAGIRAGRQAGRASQGAANLKDDQTFQANQNNDAFLLALANEDLANRKLKVDENQYNVAKADHARFSSAGDTAGANKAQIRMDNAQASMDARSQGIAAARRVTSRRSDSTRLAAVNQLAKTGYQFAPGELGYQELSETIGSITRGDAGAYSAAMDEAQFHLKNAGRLELGGINHGAGADMKGGIRKQGNYQRGQGKVDTYHGGAAAWLGKDVVGDDGKTSEDLNTVVSGIEAGIGAGTTDHNGIAEWHSMLLRDMPSATDANKLEIQKQLAAMEAVGTSQPELGAKLAENRRQLQIQQIDPSEREPK